MDASMAANHVENLVNNLENLVIEYPKVDRVVIEIPQFDHQNNPVPVEDNNRMVVELLHDVYQGKKKTIIKNFLDLCHKLIERPECHVLIFLLDISGYTDRVEGIDMPYMPYKFDGRNVNLEGELTPTEFKETMQLYIDCYVVCRICKNSSTIFRTVINVYTEIICSECGEQRISYF